MTSTRTRVAVVVAAVTALAMSAAPAAFAGGYPLPENPGKISKPTKHVKKLVASKTCTSSALRAHTCFATIAAAVAAAKQTGTHRYEYTITITKGTWREPVIAEGHQWDGLTITGSTSNAKDTIIDLSTLSAPDNQDAILINGVAGVTVKNLTVTHYKGNGVWIVNVQNMFGTKTYLVDNVIASFGGVYGIFARNSFGGTMSHSEAYYNNDSGFYVGETPTQTKPLRTTLTGLKAWGNELGFSGTNSRYVTITKSKWFNNGIGIVPNLLFSEDFPPPAFNTIIDNDVYGNNLNYFVGTNADNTSTAVATRENRIQVTPFTVNYGALGGGDYPPGMGILLFGSQDTVIQNNRIWDNHLIGVAMYNPGVLLKDTSGYRAVCGTPSVPIVSTDCTMLKEKLKLKRNKVIGNVFGRGGANLNGRDLFYANDDIGNCVGGTGANANVAMNVVLGNENQAFQSCDASGYNKLATQRMGFEAYLYGLSFTDTTSNAGTTAFGHVNNLSHDGFWLRTTGQAAWPTGFGTPIERCKFKVAATPLSGCVGDGK